jgi:hypothetical protein
VRIREEAGATNTLPLLVSLIRNSLASDTDSLDRFETLLLNAGYSSAHDQEYGKLTLRVVEEKLFAVESDFPRLTAASFGGAMPAGIERIEYEINLNGYQQELISYNQLQARSAPLGRAIES